MKIDYVIYQDLFAKWTRPKTQRRAISIIEAAVWCYHKHGIESTTYEKIAEKAGVTRPLLFKYFKDHQEIFEMSVKYIRVHFQAFAVNKMQTANTPMSKFIAYIDSTFDWVKEHPVQSGAFLLYLHKCTLNKKSRALNTEFSQAGASRISELIRWGVGTGDFTSQSLKVNPKVFQTIIAGAMITLASENLDDSRSYREEIKALCLGMLGAQNADEKE